MIEINLHFNENNYISSIMVLWFLILIEGTSASRKVGENLGELKSFRVFKSLEQGW